MGSTESTATELEELVVEWWIHGDSPRRIEERLRAERGVEMPHASVQQLIARMLKGRGGSDGLAAITLRMRLQAPALIDRTLEIGQKMFSLVAAMRGQNKEQQLTTLRELKALDLLDRQNCRRLRLAGVGSQFAARLLDRSESQKQVAAARNDAAPGDLAERSAAPGSGTPPGRRPPASTRH